MKMTEPWSSFNFLSQLVILWSVLRSSHPGFPSHLCFYQTSLLIHKWTLSVSLLFYHLGKLIYPFVFVDFLLFICIYIHMHVQLHVCREQKLMSSVLLNGSLRYDWRQSLSRKRVVINNPDWLVSRLQDGSVSALSALMFQTHMPGTRHAWVFMLGIHAQVSPLHSEHLIIWAICLPLICVFEIKVKPGLCKGPFLWQSGKFSYKFISLWNSIGALFILLLFLLLENSFYYFWKKITAFEKSQKISLLLSWFLSS